ncbi:MAG: PEP-utilizing enzyme, partial [Candidatus Woesearchaeota archaeon]
RILEEWQIKTKEEKEAYFKDIKERLFRVIDLSKKIKEIDLEKLSNSGLITLFKDYTEKTGFMHAETGAEIDAADIYPAEYLREKIKEVIDNDQIVAKLTAPIHKTYLNDEDIEVLKLISKSRKGENIDSEIKKLVKKYWWTTIDWESMRKKTEQDYIDAIKEFKGDPEEKIKEITENFENLKKQRKDLIEKYDFNQEILDLLELFDNYTLFHDYRKEMQTQTFWSTHLLLNECSQRLNIDRESLDWVWFDEIFGWLDGKEIDLDEINRREQAMCVILDNGLKTYSGEEAAKKIKQEFEQEVEDVSEIKGEVASQGKVKGRVKVCKGAEEAFEKIQEGDILVCGMTTPLYVPIMKKCSAIITNEGGITCHAAIISRELGIPCIVGTSIATDVLKDNEEVEVDAEKGVVRRKEKCQE